MEKKRQYVYLTQQHNVMCIYVLYNNSIVKCIQLITEVVLMYSPVPPNITQLTPQRQTITAPNSAIICFNATGRPRLTIIWYRVQLGGKIVSELATVTLI